MGITTAFTRHMGEESEILRLPALRAYFTQIDTNILWPKAWQLMEQEDYLKRQIDQLGRVLGKIITDLLGFKNRGQTSMGIEITNQTLKTQTDLNVEELIDIETGDFIKTLKSGKNFTNENLDQLAEIFFLIADSKPDTEKKSIYVKCLTIYEYLENAEKTYSYVRQMKINQIKAAL